jgi:hypothetical protein
MQGYDISLMGLLRTGETSSLAEMRNLLAISSNGYINLSISGKWLSTKYRLNTIEKIPPYHHMVWTLEEGDDIFVFRELSYEVCFKFNNEISNVIKCSF